MATNPLGNVLRRLRGVEVLRERGDLSDGQLLTRFLARRDEAAFEALLRRHGPMVLGVCRRLLGHDQDAEDAFQATFLVLARKAGAVVPREAVGNWLYGVAYNTARKARALNAKRRGREKQVQAMPEPHPTRQEHPLWEELQPLLDRELSRLPDKYRFAVVLCDLEGKTHKEAARQLGCPEGTVSVRLSRARALLARRLCRHGLACSGAALAALLSQNAATAGVPDRLVGPTVEAANLFAAGHTTAGGLVSANVTTLTEGVLKTMWTMKCLPLVLVLLLLGVGLLTHGMPAGEQPAGRRERPAAPAGGKRQADDGLKELQGAWKVVKLEDRGAQAPKEELKGMRWTFQGATLHISQPGNQAENAVKAAVKVDAGKDPKQIDVAPLDGPSKGKTVQGIYKLEKGRLTMCFREERNADLGRPTTFVADEANGQGVATLERVKEGDKGQAKPGKAGDKKDFAQEDWNELKGTWVTPFNRSGDGEDERRLWLELRDSGKDRLFNQYDEIKTGDGRTKKQLVHSAVLVVKSFREADGKRYLVVTPKSTPPRSEFDQRICYEFIDGQLRLEGNLGTRKLTDTWSRIVGNR